MIHLGDIRTIKGANIPPVDVVTGGSPCQDLSVAGRRTGLAGARSGLFLDQIRIIKEMRDEYGTDFPRYMVWENVPGAFSANKGRDFATVLDETIRIAEPKAPVCMCLQKAGRLGEASAMWMEDGALLGESWTLNTGESPSVAVESHSSQILMVVVPEKYYLSPKACQGILRRASARGKKLPTELKNALERQARFYIPK